MNQTRVVGCAAARPAPSQILEELASPEQRTALMVLATPHLRALGTDFHPGAMEGVLAALERFAPTEICIENLSADALASLEVRGGTALDADDNNQAKTVLAAIHAAQTGLGSSCLEARDASEKLMQKDVLSDADHAELAVLLLASADRGSAILHWAYAGPAARDVQRAKAPAATYLELALGRADEVSQLAVPLAMRRKLRRLRSVDNPLDDEHLASVPEAAYADMLKSPRVKTVVEDKVYAADAQLLKDANARGDLLPVYVRMNTAAYATHDVDTQWGVFWRIHHPSGLDRNRYALWEARNLQIAAEVAQVTALPVGGRVLVLFGAAHKPFLDEAFDHQVHVRRVELGAFAGGPAR